MAARSTTPEGKARGLLSRTTAEDSPTAFTIPDGRSKLCELEPADEEELAFCNNSPRDFCRGDSCFGCHSEGILSFVTLRGDLSNDLCKKNAVSGT